MALAKILEDLESSTRRVCGPLFFQFEKDLDDLIGNYVRYNDTGDLQYLRDELEKQRGRKENIAPNADKRNATSSIISDTENTNSSLCVSQISIKKEKVSASTLSIPTVKIEKPDMPAPCKVPPKKKTIKQEPAETSRPVRSTRTKKRNNLDDEASRESVILQNTTITKIDLTEEETAGLKSKSKRTKTRAKNNEDNVQRSDTNDTMAVQEEKNTSAIHDIKNCTVTLEKLSIEEIRPTVTLKKDDDVDAKRKYRKNSDDDHEIVKENKRSKSDSSNDEEINKTAQTEYEDAVSELNPLETGNAKQLVAEENLSKKPTASLLKSPSRTITKKQQIKEIFSPYDKTSIKTKVQAFEKLGGSCKKDNSSRLPIVRGPGSASKSKLYTPLKDKFCPLSSSTVGKSNSLSMLKSTQKYYREQEKKRQEKEKEAIIKKEAILQQQAEEKRKKREEKQLKAQQQRDLLLKAKEKQLEIQKQKEKKCSQVLAEKEEKLQKFKEAAEKKRLLAKAKAQMQKESEKKGNTPPVQKSTTVPEYLVSSPPLLASCDCYDSDDENHQKVEIRKPSWVKDMRRQLFIQVAIRGKPLNSLFGSIQQPNLEEIFEKINPRKLKRTSSAVWKKPPRYTEFDITNEIIFSEDSSLDEDF